MTEHMLDFASLLGATISLDGYLIVNKQNRYFLVNENLKKMMSESFFYAGTYLGKTRNQRLNPSFGLLRLIAKERANKIIIDPKTEWLFVCGRDVFKQGIVQAIGNVRRGKYVVVLNQHRECLGYGRVVKDLKKVSKGVVVKNMSDIGDFLRRERSESRNIASSL